MLFQSGNCELTEADKDIVVNGVTIIGHTNLPSEVPAHASQMYSKNLTTFLDHLLDDGKLVIDREDEITSGTLVSYQGEVVSEMIRSRLEANAEASPKARRRFMLEAPVIAELTVLDVALFVGVYIIGKVASLLSTRFISASNAIAGIHVNAVV